MRVRLASPTAAQIGRAIVFLLVIGAASMSLTLQGWRSRAPAFDLIPHIENAQGLVRSGTLPRHGDTGSYGSYKPPGTAWVMAPSVLLLGDARLSEHVGAAILHGIALAGLFWLAWRHFGAGAAYLSALLYALSSHGIFLAGSLWPNGRPDAYVALVVFTVLWASRRDPRFLAVAFAVWGIGMYIDMAITPAFFIFPVVWVYERPPVRLVPLAAASAVVLLVWSPYLTFEAPRAFADIRSQLLQQNIFPANYREAWCNPERVLRSLDEEERPVSVAADRIPAQARFASGRSILENAMSNFHAVAAVPGAALATFLLTLAGLAMAALSGSVAPGPATPDPARRRWTVLGYAVTATIVGVYVVTSPSLLGAHALGGPALLSVRRLLRIIAACSLLAVALPAAVAAGQRLLRLTGVEWSGRDLFEATRVLRISLIVPWAILVVAAESGKPERFWWLWPLQLAFLSGFVLVILPRLGVHRWLCRTLAAGVVVVVLWNGLLVSRLQAWAESGWAGPDAEEVQVVDALASRIAATGRLQAAIGYRTFIFPFMATYHITNPRYKAGAEFDFLLESRHGISNTDRCAEGVSPDDEYRVVQLRPKPPEWAPKHYFDLPADERFSPVGEVARYRLLKADR